MWCQAGGLSVGCFAYGACPAGSNAASQRSCPVTFDSCPMIQTCSDCQQNNGCQWCSTGSSSYSSNYGCLSNAYNCPSNSYGNNGCPSTSISSSIGSIISISTVSVSMVVGLLIGALGYFVGHSADVKKQQSISLIVCSFFFCKLAVFSSVFFSQKLFFLSFVFWGASLFSFLLSCKVISKASRKCCNGYCFCVYFFGIFELVCVLSGFLTGVIMDASLYNYYNPGGIFTLVIGLPTAVSGILCFGIPRVAVAGCASKLKPKSDSDLSEDSERTPLIYEVARPVAQPIPQHMPPQQQQQHVAVPPAGYNYAHVQHQQHPAPYGSLGSMPVGAPAVAPFAPNYASGPGAVEYK